MHVTEVCINSLFGKYYFASSKHPVTIRVTPDWKDGSVIKSIMMGLKLEGHKQKTKRAS